MTTSKTRKNSSQSAYQDPTPAVEQAGLTNAFKYGEYFFERTYTQNNPPFKGLGPLYIRNSCIACHPGYGHGMRMNRYRADEWGNQFPDGERYNLTYPEVYIPEEAFYVPLQVGGNDIPYSDFVCRLESTIGVYGTGLIDAIPDDSLKNGSLHDRRLRHQGFTRPRCAS